MNRFIAGATGTCYTIAPRSSAASLGNPGDRRCEVHAATCEESEPERSGGTVGPFHQIRMPVEADLVWGDLAMARGVGVSGTLSSREKPPRQGQPIAFPGISSECLRPAAFDRLPGTARPLTQILQARRLTTVANRLPSISRRF